jgi:hypothetical protein
VKNPIDPRLARLRSLYRELDSIPGRKKAFAETMKAEKERLQEQIEEVWSGLLDETPAQAPLTFPVHHGGNLVGRARQPKVGGGGR